MCMFRLPNGQLISRGYVANFSQDVNSICKILPRLTVPVLIVRRKGQKNTHKDFKVNRKRIEICLKYLCENNPAYKNNRITMSSENLNQLPENGKTK